MDAQDTSRIATSSLFRGVDPSTVAPLLARCAVEQRPSGSVILSTSIRNTHAFVIIEGRADVHLDSSSASPHMSLGPGSCLGELSLIDGRLPTASVVATAPLRLLVLPPEVLWSLVDASHVFARNLLYVLSGRMRNENRALVEAQRARQVLEHAVGVDGLTGLHNRRWMAEWFPRQLERCHRDGQPVSAIIVDVDHFKRLNDGHGHQAGDAVLRALCCVLAAHVRPGDLLARYGGEEFAALLPGAGREAALELGERLRAAVERERVIDHEGRSLPPLTISVGVAEALPAEDLEALLGRADEALYGAKHAGRNRVQG